MKKENYNWAIGEIIQKMVTGMLILFLVALSSAGFTQDIPERPSPPKLVNDFADLLSASQRASLEKKLVDYDDSTSTQIAVVTVQTTGDYAMVDYAVKLGRAWGVGGKKFDNGVIILVAADDHKVFIATGYGMEGAIPDITAKQIIDYNIVPAFKRGDFYKGLNQGSSAIIKAAAGEYKAPKGYRQKEQSKGGGAGFFFLFFLILIIVISISTRNRGNDDNDGDHYNNRGRRYGLGPFVGGMFLGGMLGGGRRGGGFGGGGFGGGGFGGGGFGGFGGGGFGGGGAGGGW